MNLLDSTQAVLCAANARAQRIFVIVLTAIVLALCGAAFGVSTAYADDVVADSSSAASSSSEVQSRASSDSALIYIEGKNNQSEARKMLDYVNAVRLSKSSSLSKLTWDYELEEKAKQRAAEIAIYYDANYRPDGTSFGTIIPSGHIDWGESIVAGTGVMPASSAIAAWKDNASNQQKMEDSAFKCMGAASFTVSGATYWVVIYGTTNDQKTPTSVSDGNETYRVFARPNNLNMSFSSTLPSTVTQGYSMQYALVNTNIPLSKNYGGTWKDHKTAVKNSNFTWTSSNVGVVSIDTKTGKVIAQAKGTTTIKATNMTLPSFVVSASSTIAIGAKPSVQNPGTGNASSSNISTSSSKYKEGWVKSGSRWWYRYSDGSYPTGLKKIGSATYYFDSNGWMKTGWQHATGNKDWYYFTSSGAMRTGWLKTGGKWYYLNSSGKMLTGKQTISGKTYFLNTSGAMHTGWKKESRSWYYYGSSGAMAKGWIKTGGKWYYLDLSSGAMKTGKFSVGKSVYYADTSGAMQTGWRKLNGKWFYFAGSGAMKTGWLKSGKYWYYLGDDGEMFSGVQALLNKRIYRFKSSGEMVTGWNRESYGWCYYNSSGALVMDSWIQNKYWVGSSGAMATSSWVDGGRYYVNSKGEWVKGMKK